MKAEDLCGGQELLCINTEKVYDWVVNESTFDLSLTDMGLPINPVTGVQLALADIDLDSVSSTILPVTTEVIDRTDQQFIIDGAEVTLQQVNFRKTFTVTVSVDLLPALGGATVEVGTIDFTRGELVLLCAPDGTDVNVTFTDLDSFVSTVTGTPGATTVDIDTLDVTISTRLCQSIQSIFPVTLEITADFCQPRDVLPIPPCPAPAIPPQCPVVFPSGDNGTTT